MTAAYLFVPGLRLGPIFNLIAISSPIAILIAVRLWKPQTRLPWYLFALGMTFFVAGDVITYNYDRFFGTELPFPSIGDVFYLSVYPCLVAGILLLVRRSNPGGDRDSVIDSLIVAIGVGTISWVFLLSPLAHDSVSTLLQKVTAMGYPVMDLILLTVVVRLAIGGGRRAASFYLMAGAALALFATDFAYSYLSVQGIVYDQAGYLEAGWATFYILWGAAALHGSMRTLSERVVDVAPRLSRSRLTILALASLLAPSVMMIQHLRNATEDLPVLIGAAGVLFLLVVMRIAGLVRKQEQSGIRERALRGAGTALVTATNRDGIYAATLQAAGSIAGEGSVIRVLVADEAPDEYSIVAAAGGSEDVVGKIISLASLRAWKVERLRSHRSYEVPVHEAELAEPLGIPDGCTYLLSGPLFMKEELRGLLVVASQMALPRENRETLEALTSQVALALDSAALTEDLLRQQTEARFRSLVQNSTDVVMVVDADSTVRYVSPSVEGVFGYDPAELEGTKLTGLIHPDDKAPVLQFLTATSREGGVPTTLIESRMRHRDDFWLHIETLRTDLMHDPNVKGIVLNSRDVSERKAFEEQLVAPGLPRLDHRAREPRALPRPRRARAGAPDAQRPADVGPVHGPRRLQDDQRFARTCGRRPPAGRGRGAAPDVPPHAGHGRPPRWRRVRDPARGRWRGRRCGRRRRPDPQGAGCSVPARREGGLRPSEHRDRELGCERDDRAGGSGGAPPQRGRRDVHREGSGEEPVSGLRTEDARHGPPEAGAEGGPPAGRRQRGVRPPLPAGDPSGERGDRWVRGPGPLEPSHPGARQAPRLHPPRRGDGPDRSDRHVGARRKRAGVGSSCSPSIPTIGRCTWR